MNPKQFLKRNAQILNYASMDTYCGFPAGTFSAVVRGKLKLTDERKEIFLALVNRIADDCAACLFFTQVPLILKPTGKGVRK